MYLKIVSFFTAVSLFGSVLSRSVRSTGRDYRGKCAEESQYQCSKYGFYEVKQCLDGADKCDCVDAWEGSVHTKVAKDKDCPACLLANARSYKKSAEGMTDLDFWKCDSEGFYSRDPQCFSWGMRCYCKTREGEELKRQVGLTAEEQLAFTCDDVQ